LPVDLYPDLGRIDAAPLRWLMPARFVEKKGHKVTLQAFRKYLDQHPNDRLTCWGYGDPRRLRTAVARLGLQNSVDVIHNGAEGSFDEAFVRRLASHHAILAPSVRSSRGDDEGGPALTVVLAQAAGKPVIVSDYPGHERSVSNGVEGIVVPQGDADALARAMAEFAANRARATAMGKAGRKRARKEFSEASYRDALVGWYSVLGGESAPRRTR
jgi:colanic acid/amylovoran biosynthesis glycosyltransferase